MNTEEWLCRFQEAHGHKPCALITGGSSGMGLEYARQLAEIGCNLLLVSNQEVELKNAAEELKQDRILRLKHLLKNCWSFASRKALPLTFLLTMLGCSFLRS